jgi:methylisocitrate lyase
MEVQIPKLIFGVLSPYHALLAKEYKVEFLYLSGSGVASFYYGLPDLGLITFTEVFDVANRITAVTDLPLIVDCDTGFGNELVIERVVKCAIAANVWGIQIEDQRSDKRCGHRPGKEVVTSEEMGMRLQSAASAIATHDHRENKLKIIARTDAYGSLISKGTSPDEALKEVVLRGEKYSQEGADIIFPEGLKTLTEFGAVSNNVSKPVLANSTEFGVTPIFSIKEYSDIGISYVLYPLTTFRAMNKSVREIFATKDNVEFQQAYLSKMETRSELYSTLDYHKFEERQDKLLRG